MRVSLTPTLPKTKHCKKVDVEWTWDGHFYAAIKLVDANPKLLDTVIWAEHAIRVKKKRQDVRKGIVQACFVHFFVCMCGGITLATVEAQLLTNKGAG